MALGDIINKIKQDAENEVSNIKEETKKKIAAIEEEFRKKIDSLRESLLKEVEEKLNLKRQKELIEIELNYRRELLAGKNKLINEVFEEAFRRLRSLPKEQMVNLLKNIALHFINENDDVEIIIAEKYEKEIQAELTNCFKNAKVTVSSNISEGLMIKKKNTLQEMNCTFEMLFKKIYETKIAEVHKTLFEDAT